MFGNCCGKTSVMDDMNSPMSEELTTSEVPVKGHISLIVDTSLQEIINDIEDDQEDYVELGGMLEPPVTPVGRDELALRRHRFFNDLMVASQSTHRVRFDPRGPSISGESEELQSGHFQDLEALVDRLEVVTNRLENLVLKAQTFGVTDISQDISETISPIPTTIKMSVQGYKDIIEGPLANYDKISQEIGGDVAKLANLVVDVFKTQLSYIQLAASRSAPQQTELVSLLGPTSTKIQAIQTMRESNRTSPYFNHLSAISESIPALGWVTVKLVPAPYIKEMNDASQFYSNRVLKDWKEKNKNHVEWVKAWTETLTELQKYVKQHHTTGLVWSNKGGSGPPPPPPGGLPPPPPPIQDLSLDSSGGDERSALFAEINQGENITKHLKKVTSEMQTHKNPGLRSGPAPFKAPVQNSTSSPASKPSTVKPPVFTRDGKKWLIEYQKGNKNLVVENAEMNNVVYMFGCVDSTLTVKGKINSVFLDSCKKTSVLFDSLVSSVEFVNCQSVQMQVLRKVPTITIDKTDGCQMFLSKESLDVEIVSSKSSEMNVLIPTASGEYIEVPMPEQYKTVVVGQSLTTTPIESKG